MDLLGSCEVLQQDAQQVVRTQGRAALEKEPSGLRVVKQGDALQKPVLVRALAADGRRKHHASRENKHVEPVAVRGKAPVADPDRLRSQLRGQQCAVGGFQMRVLPSCARFQSAAASRS